MISNSFVFAPVVVLAAGLGLHRAAPGVGLHAALAPARDSARRRARRPCGRSRRRRRGRASACRRGSGRRRRPVPQKTPSIELYGLPGAELELGVGGDVDVVADPHLGPERLRERRAERERCPPSRAGCGPPRRRRSPRSVSPGEPTPTPASESVSTPAASAASISAAAISRGDVLGPALGRGRAPGLADDLAARGSRSPPGSSSRRGRCRREARRRPPRGESMPGAVRGANSASEWAMIAATIVSSTEGTSTSATTSWIFGAARAACSSIRRRASRRSAVACRWSCSASGEP